MGSQELPVLGWSWNLTYRVTSEKLLPLSEPQTSPQKEGVELVRHIRLTCDETILMPAPCLLVRNLGELVTPTRKWGRLLQVTD